MKVNVTRAAARTKAAESPQCYTARNQDRILDAAIAIVIDRFPGRSYACIGKTTNSYTFEVFIPGEEHGAN